VVTAQVSTPRQRLTHLDLLEAEAIHIIREVAAEFAKPVMLYSVGKDSSVMLRLAQKAFAPGKIPFPLLHVDTTFKFREMYDFRDRMAREAGAELLIHKQKDALAQGTAPWVVGTKACCALWKTKGLLDGLGEYQFDAAFGGARREEEKSRAKERVFSFRDEHGQWDPKNQRPELWNLFNAKIGDGESIRVFPLSNWTEVDVWLYIHRESIPVVPLYFAAPRRVVVRTGANGAEMLIPMDPDVEKRIAATRLAPPPTQEVVSRFRSLGCVPCTGAVRSTATSVPEIIAELCDERQSERATRVIDHDSEGSMEQKKREGYF
jgi:sulfate adenylyltransferase subunit 2